LATERPPGKYCDTHTQRLNRIGAFAAVCVNANQNSVCPK
jgi:hypothetical protein